MKKNLSLLDKLDPKNILFVVNLINTVIASLYNYFQSKIGFVFLLIINVMFSRISCHFAEFDLSDKFVIFHKFLLYLYLTTLLVLPQCQEKYITTYVLFPMILQLVATSWAFFKLDDALTAIIVFIGIWISGFIATTNTSGFFIVATIVYTLIVLITDERFEEFIENTKKHDKDKQVNDRGFRYRFLFVSSMIYIGVLTLQTIFTLRNIKLPHLSEVNSPYKVFLDSMLSLGNGYVIALFSLGLGLFYYAMIEFALFIKNKTASKRQV